MTLPIRHWICSLPWGLSALLGYDKKLLLDARGQPAARRRRHMIVRRPTLTVAAKAGRTSLFEGNEVARTKSAKAKVDAKPEGASAVPRVHHLRIGGEDIRVLSYPLPSVGAGGPLTGAEQAVAAEVLRGRSNAEIAEARGSSTRTVANQVASILRKLGIQSRHELAAALGRGGVSR